MSSISGYRITCGEQVSKKPLPRRRIARLSTAIVCLVAVLGCTENRHRPSQQQTPTGTALPGLSGDGDCDSVEIDTCFWALSADAVVWGAVTGLRFPDSPFANVVSYDPLEVELLDECGGPANRPFEVDLEVTTAIAGNVAGGKLSFRVGEFQLDHFSPQPRAATDGGIGWTTGESVGKPLEVGKKVGVALIYFNEFDKWSLRATHHPMFELQPLEDGTPVTTFQRAKSSCYYVPSDGGGLGIDEFIRKVESCSAQASQAALEKNAWLHEAGTREPRQSIAGSCFD